MVLSGVFRSAGFSAYDSLPFADVEPADLADVHTLSSPLQQVAAGPGVAVGALLLRWSGHALGSASTSSITAYGLTFPLLAVIVRQLLVQVLRLRSSAGRELTARRAAA